MLFPSSISIFLDSVIASEIKKYAWLVKGITTTPTFFKRDGVNYDEFITNVRTDYPQLEVHVEALGPTPAETEKEINKIIDQNWYDPEKVVLKIPISFENLKLVKKYSTKNVRFNVHLIFTPQQVALAAQAGGAYVCPLLGRFADIESKNSSANERDKISRALIKNVVEVTRASGTDTLVMASSIRSEADFLNACHEEADIITVPTKILDKLFDHPMTTEGINTFLKDMGYDK